MAHAETIARELGRPRIRLYTNQKFVENIRLYLRLCYVVDRELEQVTGIRVDMSKSLAPDA